MSVIADRYELHEPLGHGGMARVFVAHDRILDRRIALKLLRDDIGRDEVLRERFLREARVAGGLAHRHIVRVYDAGVEDETPWIAMELVEGPSLREAMSTTGPYDAATAVGLIGQVLEALEVAHAAGVVHRDIKPANILLADDGPKLSDFGIAKSLQGGADLTQTNQFMGTPKYTAPEVAMGHPATPQADVYSSAVLLWEMLAGAPPYEHENPLSLAMMHRTDPLPSLAAARPDLPVTLVAAVEAGLAKEAPDRPVNATAFAALLDAGLRGDASAAAHMTATAVLPRVPLPPTAPPPSGAPSPAPQPLPREQTAVMPAPDVAAAVGRARAAGGAAPARVGTRTAPPSRGRGGTLGVVLVVLLLLALAAFAYSRAEQDGVVDPSETPATATPTPSTEPTPSATEPEVPATAPVQEEPAPPAPPPAPAQTTPPATTEPPETTPPTVPPATDTPAQPTEPVPTPQQTAVPVIPVPGEEPPPTEG